MINLSINREPFRAEQELLSVHTGIAKYLHSLFHPKGFFILGCVTLLNTSRFGMQGQAIRCLRSTNCISLSAFYFRQGMLPNNPKKGSKIVTRKVKQGTNKGKTGRLREYRDRDGVKHSAPAPKKK